MTHGVEFAGLEHQNFANGDVNLHAVCAGPVTGPAVVLLHGFPEFWFGWRRQIAPLAAAGFRVIVPDQRGYNVSAKPASVGAYSLPKLTSDVISIVDQLHLEKILLAGHDWGAAVAWNTALHFADRVEKLAILNVPHPSVMKRGLTRPEQLLRSWYMFFFQLPLLPEAAFRANNFRLGTASLINSSRPRTFTEEDLQQYRNAWSQPGAVRGMMHWYRALFRHPPRVPKARLNVPTLILWGAHDRFLLRSLAAESAAECENARLVYFDDATHWIQHEEPERVSKLLCEFFS